MTVYKSPRGRWMIGIDWRTPAGKLQRVRKVAPVQTKAGALKYELQLRQALLDGTYQATEPAAATTFAAFSKEYLEYSRTNNRARTWREKVATFRRALVPFFGAMRLDAIGFREFERYKAERVARGLHAKTINDELALVVGALRLAVKYQLIGAAPSFDRLRPPPSEFDFLDFGEAARLVTAAQREQPWGTMILVALRTGLRRGELRALRWQDIDLTKGRLTVRQAADDKGAITPPKNGKHRTIDLGADALAALKQHKASEPAWIGDAAAAALVFNRGGDMFTQREMERPIARACQRAGLRSVGWHVLRHTFASHLAMRGVNSITIQALGGWDTIAMVNRYAHLSPDARRDAVQLLDGGAPGEHEKADEA